MSLLDKQTWLCRNCINIFPFNHCQDNDLFLQLANNTYTNKGLRSRCNELIFDPFETNSLDINSWDKSDPDLNYYIHNQDMSTCNSEYFDIEPFNEALKQTNLHCGTFSLLHNNIRSASKNANDLSIFLTTLNKKFDIIALSETWITDSDESIHGFSDYSQIHNCRTNINGGGVSILIHNQWSYNQLNDLSNMDDIYESTFVEIETSGRNIIVGCIYRPPNSNLIKFNEIMDNMLKKLINFNKDVYILGDFNINLLNWKTHNNTSEFANVIFSNSFLPLINRPTRVTESSATLIDNILTNSHDSTNKCFSGILPTDMSDHFTIFHIIDMKKSQSINKHKHAPSRVINDMTILNLKSNIEKSDWRCVLDCKEANTAYDIFDKKFNLLYNENIPLRKNKSKNNTARKPWVTKALLISIKKKNKMYTSYRINGDVHLHNAFKKYKNRLTKLLRIAEKTFYKCQIENNKNNLKKTWNTLRSMINKRKSTQVTSVNINGRKIMGDCNIANHFNKYFVNAPHELCTKFPSASIDPCSYIKKHIKKSLYMRSTTEDEIQMVLSTLRNSSPGYDDINVRVLKRIKDQIIKPLTHLCNLSLENGVVPDKLKIAKVIPIHKKGAKDQLNNYRPVSVLTCISKIYERLVYNRIVEFLDKHKILSRQQFGFRKQHSTTLAINALMNRFHESIENNDIMLGLFIDLSRAFDTISHKILLNKLYCYGIRGIALNWIKDYLTNRMQFVSYNNSISEMKSVDIGVPQGSILGPLLFLLYVNDLPMISKELSFIQFADDTSIFINGKSLSDMSKIMNTEMKNVCKWLKCNMLTLNVSKTNYMIMTNKGKFYDKNECQITIDGSVLNCVQNTTFFGCSAR